MKEHMTNQEKLSDKLVDDLLNVIYKYDMVNMATVFDVMDTVKQQLINDGINRDAAMLSGGGESL